MWSFIDNLFTLKMFLSLNVCWYKIVISISRYYLHLNVPIVNFPEFSKIRQSKVKMRGHFEKVKILKSLKRLLRVNVFFRVLDIILKQLMTEMFRKSMKVLRLAGIIFFQKWKRILSIGITTFINVLLQFQILPDLLIFIFKYSVQFYLRCSMGFFDWVPRS